MYLLARTRAGKHLILSTSQQAAAGWVSVDTDASLIGAEGEVHSALRPAGTVNINGKRVDAVSEGSFIDKGARVRVLEVHGSRVVVEQINTP
jgi:membrane-bound serine protease (ClpP class)